MPFNTGNKIDVKEMMEQARQEAEAKKTEQSIIDRAPELKQLAETINKATEALNKARTELNAAVVEYRKTVNKTGEVANGIHTKIDSINTHIDGVMKDAPSKLTVSVSATDADLETIKSVINTKHQSLIEELGKHYNKVNRRLERENRDSTLRYEEAEGVWFGYHMQWFFLPFFYFGCFGFAAIVVVIIGRCCGWF